MCAQATKIFVNGVWVGIHRDPAMLVQTLRAMRRQCDISTEVSGHFLLALYLCMGWRTAGTPLCMCMVPGTIDRHTRCYMDASTQTPVTSAHNASYVTWLEQEISCYMVGKLGRPTSNNHVAHTVRSAGNLSHVRSSSTSSACDSTASCHARRWASCMASGCRSCGCSRTTDAATALDLPVNGVGLPRAQVGIVHDIRLQELRLFTDYGRCCRPLFIVDLRQQRLHIRKEHVRQLQDRETTAFGWQARAPPGITSKI